MPKIVQYNLPPGGTVTRIADNQVALEIESTDAEKYISLDTTDNASKVLILSTHTEADNQSSGFVGIREAAPKAPIHITGTGGSTGISINPTLSNSPCLLIENSTNNSKDRAMVLVNGDGGSGGVIQLHHADTRRMILQGSSVANLRGDGCTLQLDTSGANIITFGINEAEKMRLDASGNLGIAMTPGGSHKIDVTGSAGLSTGTAWTNTSDSRVKTNVATIENALDKINQLRPVSFQYTEEYLSVHTEIDASKTYNSFIAEEYEAVFPDAVTIQGDLKRKTSEEIPANLDNGTPAVPAEYETLLEDVKQFTPHDLTMYLVRAVQELSKKCDSLTAQVDEIGS